MNPLAKMIGRTGGRVDEMMCNTATVQMLTVDCEIWTC